jgi:hypothetical protein
MRQRSRRVSCMSACSRPGVHAVSRRLPARHRRTLPSMRRDRILPASPQLRRPGWLATEGAGRSAAGGEAARGSERRAVVLLCCDGLDERIRHARAVVGTMLVRATDTVCARAGCAAAIASTSACVTAPSRKGCRTTRRTRCRCRHRDRRSASRIVPCASRRTSTAPVPSTKLVAATVGDPPDLTRFLSPVRRADADSDHSQGRTLEHKYGPHCQACNRRPRPR